MARAGGNVVLSWPASLGAVVLEKTESLAHPQWQPATAEVLENGATVSITLPADSDSAFWRLRR